MSHRALRSRGFMLYAALIVVTIGAMMAATAVYAAHAQRASANAAARRVQSRAIAWSGVQAALEELNRQRDQMIRGQEAALPEDWTLFAEADGRAAVARLVPQAEDALLVSEGGKMDVNTASEAMLAAVPGLDADIAKRIVAVRAGGKLFSVLELAGIEGLRSAFSAEPAAQVAENRDAFVPPEEAAPGRPLTELLTVFSFEPNVQAGMGRNAETHTGVRRIALAAKWSDRLGRAIADRFDEGASNLVKTLMEQGTKFEKESDIVKVLRRFNVPPGDWAEVLDAFCGDPGPYRLGRVDVLHAPQDVLACVPGVDASAAAEIVLRRGKLAPEQRLSLVWLVEENILTADQFELAVDVLGTRSMQWRIVMEAGFLAAEGEDPAERPPLADRVVVEAVLDVSSERPRVAYLREITLADAARTLGPLRPATAGEEEDDRDGASAAGGEPVSSSPAAPGRGREAVERARPEPPVGPPEIPSVDGAAAEVERDPRIGRWTPGRQ